MRSSLSCRPDDFDDNGLLKAPRLFWGGGIVLARAWWLTGLAMTSEHGERWLVQFYPDAALQWLGLSAGLPAVIMLFCYPLRGQFPVLIRFAYLLMLTAALVTLTGEGVILLRMSPEQWDMGWFLLCADIACMAMLWPDRWLRTIFFRNDELQKNFLKTTGNRFVVYDENINRKIK
ncbi:DUF2919 domain-containing protein [Salmonella enterica]|uniref:DUF2919 domain-containing protein n=1 Tax=Salmonella enterica TaxID=28901 RepID=A0A5Y4A1E8_SALER|nr:DUF2919 domain-containing protein [Salmonella enterica]